MVGTNEMTGGDAREGAGEGGNAGELNHPAAVVRAAESAPVGGRATVRAAEAASGTEKTAALLGGDITAPPPPVGARRKNGGGVESGGNETTATPDIP